ncbi:Sucrase/ferredoxin-like-domain-containing protein, partial [Podospora aff. communis PSN243]
PSLAPRHSSPPTMFSKATARLILPHRLFSTKKPAPFPTIATCPSPTCPCAPTPSMPPGFEIDRKTPLNGLISNYAQHVLICTGKNDWPSKIEDDSGDNLAADLKELIGGRGAVFSDPFQNVSILNSSFPSSVSRKSPLQTTSAYLLPAFKYVPFLPRVSFDSVEALVKGYLLPEKLHSAHDGLSPIHRDRLTRKPAYRGLLWGVRDVEDVLVLVCGHGGRDQRCGIFGPLLRREFEERLGGMGVDVLREEVDVEEGGRGLLEGEVGETRTTARVGLISHIGGHKFAGNVVIYLPPGLKTREGKRHPLAGAGIWYERVEPRHVEGIVRETILKGNVIAETTTWISRPFTITRLGRRIPWNSTLRRAFASEPERPPRARRIVKLKSLVYFAVLISLPYATYGWYERKSRPKLNGTSFVPFIITHKEQVSSSAFILTAMPKHMEGIKTEGTEGFFSRRIGAKHRNREILEDAWKHGLWSVEIKQPQIQVSRDYTPLPPASPEAEDEDLVYSKLRFLVRKIDGGEVSTYLSGLHVGDTVELRGPHLGFNAARAVLNDNPDRSNLSISILWSNRHRDDCPGIPCPQQGTKPPHGGAPNAMTSLLSQFRTRYGDKFTYASTVDEESTSITDRNILTAAQAPSKKTLTNKTISSSSLPPAATPCGYHSATALPSSSGRDATLEKSAACGCLDADGTPLKKTGKNLLMVSGPEGFITHFAGPKKWAQGMELQGPLGGVAARLWASNPTFWANWLVLKL